MYIFILKNILNITVIVSVPVIFSGRALTVVLQKNHN